MEKKEEQKEKLRSLITSKFAEFYSTKFGNMNLVEARIERYTEEIIGYLEKLKVISS